MTKFFIEGHEEAAEKGKAPPMFLGDAYLKATHFLASALEPGLNLSVKRWNA